MRSDKQIEASRQNGKKSRGPVTAQGRLNSAGNRLTHGLAARTILLKHESPKRLGSLIERLYTEFQPQSYCQELLVEKMIVAQWRQMRLWNYEKSSILREAEKHRQSTGDVSPLDIDALACETGNAARFNQQEMRLDRQFNRALDRLI